MDTNSGGDTIGRAANRYVTFQIVMTIVGLIIAAAFFFGFFLPMFHQANGEQTATDQQMSQQRSAMSAQMPGTTVTTSEWHKTK